MSTELLIQSLSLEEKVSLLAGHSYWRTASLPQHGIKPIKYSDGPNGVRGESIHASTKATCFPCAACVGATFNPDFALRMGRVIGRESRAKGIGLVLGPTTSNSILDEKTLRELYAYAFQVLLKNSTPWCIMTSYNLVNGVFMSENKDLLQGLLRKEWGYQGAIVSDFEGVYSTVPSVLAGVALELPGPARFRGERLLQAVKDGQVPESQIDALIPDVITLASKVGMEDENLVEEDTKPTETTTALLRDIAAEGIVLVKNKDNILPILPTKRPKIAVFGSPAATPIIHGGGSASLTPVYVSTPLEALEQKYGRENITYQPGVPIFKKIPSASISVMRALSNGQPGVDCYWYNGWTIGENQIYHEVLESTRTLVIEPRISELEPTHCSRMAFILKPQTSGTHAFGVTACGKCVLRVDDEAILEHTGFTDVRVEYVMQPGDFEVRKNMDMVAGREELRFI
ncbi:glycoside hydrolase superfamily [Aspergillus germanicus]